MTLTAAPNRTLRAGTRLAAAGAGLLLLAGCGGGSSSPSTGQTSAARFSHDAVAFSVCMRDHGVPGFPDPQISSSGNRVQVRISPGTANLNSPAFKSAARSCRRLAPVGGPPGGRGAVSPQEHAQDLRFAACMRRHGVPGFPDPDLDGVFTLPSSLDPQAPRFQAAMHDCAGVQPRSLSLDQQPPSP